MIISGKSWMLELEPRLDYTLVSPSSSQLWDSLCSAWDGKSASNKVFLMKKLMRLSMKEGSSVSSHLNEFNALYSQLTSKGLNFDDDMKAIFLLCSLPASWDTFKSAISNSTHGGKLAFGDVTSALLIEEIRCQSLDRGGHGDVVGYAALGMSLIEGSEVATAIISLNDDMFPKLSSLQGKESLAYLFSQRGPFEDIEKLVKNMDQITHKFILKVIMLQCEGCLMKILFRRTFFKTTLGYTSYQLVFGKEAILPIEVQLANLRVLVESGRDRPSEQLRSRILKLERLELDRTTAIEHYTAQAVHRKKKFDEGLKDKGLKRRMLVLRYDNRFDTRKDKKFMNRWEGPFFIYKKYTNGSYRLQDISGKLHKTRANGWHLKPFFQRFDSQFMFDAPARTEEDEEEQPSSSNRHQDLEIGLEA
ncbi:hypothetical protein L7F22_043400 [Adiantum nelumboides]|nr:hypothetical protein [Adiantum nelumboides]